MSLKEYYNNRKNFLDPDFIKRLGWASNKDEIEPFVDSLRENLNKFERKERIFELSKISLATKIAKDALEIDAELKRTGILRKKKIPRAYLYNTLFHMRMNRINECIAFLRCHKKCKNKNITYISKVRLGEALNSDSRRENAKKVIKKYKDADAPIKHSSIIRELREDNFDKSSVSSKIITRIHKNLERTFFKQTLTDELIDSLEELLKFIQETINSSRPNSVNKEKRTPWSKQKEWSNSTNHNSNEENS